MTRRKKPPPLMETMPKGLTDAQSWRLWLKCLRERVPTEYPVEVRRVERMKPREPADCGFDEGRQCFVIRIRKSLRRSEAREALIHEWAHARAWFRPGHDKQPHGYWWGVEYSRAYQATIEH